MTALIANNAVGALASSINTSVLTLALGSGQGALFPSPGAGEFFYITLTRASDGGIEIMKCTARSTDTLTVVRAQDGTTAKTFATSDRVELRFVRAIHTNYPQLDTANTFVPRQTFTAGWDADGNCDIDGNLNVADLAVEDDLTVAGAAILSGILTVAGAATFNGSATFNGALLKGSNKVDALPAGVIIPFRQSAVPAGWTKITTWDDAALRIVSGTPGAQATAGKEFTTYFAARTILATYLPDHTITITDPGHTHTETSTNFVNRDLASGGSTCGTSETTINTSSATTGITAAFGNTARGGAQTAMPFDVNYVDLYLASKDA